MRSGPAERPAEEARMSDMVSPHATAFEGAPARVRRVRAIPIGYGLLFGAILSIAMWIGLVLAVVRFWPS